MNRKNAFDAAAVRNTADSKGFLNATVLHRDDGALEDLNSLFVALFDFAVNFNRIADCDRRFFFFHACAGNNFQCVHCCVILLI